MNVTEITMTITNLRAADHPLLVCGGITMHHRIAICSVLVVKRPANNDRQSGKTMMSGYLEQMLWTHLHCVWVCLCSVSTYLSSSLLTAYK